MKQKLLAFLRQFNLLMITDKLRFYLMQVKNAGDNKSFLRKFPDVKLPPDYLMYESFQLNYTKYYIGGKDDAEVIVQAIRLYVESDKYRILDWGCGPARIIRHIPGFLGDQNFYAGCDYNSRTIAWCKSNLTGIEFEVNLLLPPLKYMDNQFNFIYGISVLTHLSEDKHKLWVKELYRILSHKGVVYLTTQGDAFLEKLLEKEKSDYLSNTLIVRANVVEGHRVFSAYHPPIFVRHLLLSNGFQILTHKPGTKVNDTYISQDIWIARKS